MSDICRLCLSFCTENMQPLSDCDDFLYNRVGLHIPQNQQLPSHICMMCVKKLTDFNEFCTKIRKNEELLLSKLHYGRSALNNFYEHIKKETNALLYENKDTVDRLKENDEPIKQVKIEDYSNLENDIDFDSEDDMPLVKTVDNSQKDNVSIENEIMTNEPGIKHLEKNSSKHNILNFKCLTCFNKFTSQNQLLTHYNNIHKSKEVKENNYTVVDNHGKVLYKCDKCDDSYDNISSVNKHARIHDNKNFHCRVCGRTYKTVSEIIRHGRAHDGTKMSCSFGCGFATVYSGALKSHEQRHREDYKYKCEACGKTFQVKTWYEQHQNIHTGAKPYVCDICGVAFHMDRYLKAHCSATHPDSSSKKRYICVQCSKPCGNMKALTRHLKEHGITSSLLCDLCGKTYSSSELLAIHRRRHTGDKPYCCSICNKGFAKRSNMKLHQITHSGERAHACSSCGKRYSQRSTMLRHVHRHHRKCQKCDVTFTTPAEISAHKKSCS